MSSTKTSPLHEVVAVPSEQESDNTQESAVEKNSTDSMTDTENAPQTATGTCQSAESAAGDSPLATDNLYPTPSEYAHDAAQVASSDNEEISFAKDKEAEEIIEGIQEELPAPAKEEKPEDVSNSEVASLADARPLNQPKGKRPPTKTREERGLPPLDEEGNEPPTEPEEKGMTLMEHLAELRTRLVRAFIVVGMAFIVSYTFAEQLFAALCQPLIDALPEGSKLIFTALPEAFFVYLQVGLVAAVFVASPYLFYQIWGFVSPGLYEEEKKYMVPMALISAIFFIGGASFCFFVVFPYAFTFFVGFASEDIAAMPSLSEYLGFALKLLIAFGLIFEMPLFTFFLARMGVVTAQIMRNGRKYAVLCIFIVAAILTPPDVISQLLMAFPMMLLYEMSIGVAAIFGRKKKSDEAEKNDAEASDESEKNTLDGEESKA